jgi:chromosome partitioning protein
MEQPNAAGHAANATADASATPGHPISRVMAFMNQKGGVGKTTTVVNLAAALAELGRSTLVVDMDPQAHATLHLGVDADTADSSVYDLLLNDSPTAADARKAVIQARPNLGLIPAVTDHAAIETELASAPQRHLRLRNSLDHLLPDYEYILIDCPPSLGLLTLNGLAAAREVVVPMQAHFLALQGVGKLLETVSLVAREINPKLRVSGVVLSMHEENTRLSKEIVADLEQFFKDSMQQDVPWKGARVLRPAIRRNIKLAESPSFGQTIFEYARWCPGAMDYAQLAANITAEWDRFVEKRGLKNGNRASIEAKPSEPVQRAESEA